MLIDESNSASPQKHKSSAGTFYKMIYYICKKHGGKLNGALIKETGKMCCELQEKKYEDNVLHRLNSRASLDNYIAWDTCITCIIFNAGYLRKDTYSKKTTLSMLNKLSMLCLLLLRQSFSKNES